MVLLAFHSIKQLASECCFGVPTQPPAVICYVWTLWKDLWNLQLAGLSDRQLASTDTLHCCEEILVINFASYKWQIFFTKAVEKSTRTNKLDITKYIKMLLRPEEFTLTSLGWFSSHINSLKTKHHHVLLLFMPTNPLYFPWELKCFQRYVYIAFCVLFCLYSSYY